MPRFVTSSLRFVAAMGLAGAIAVFAVASSPEARAIGAGTANPNKSCNSGSACATFTNAGIGPAILASETGGGAGGDAIVGVAYAAGHAGVHGETLNQSARNGQAGTGVLGDDLSPDQGNANSGVGGGSTWGTGVTGVSMNFFGIQAITNNGTGAILATTFSEANLNHHISYGVIAADQSNNSGANNGGLWAQSANGIGVHSIGNPSLIAIGNSAGATLFTAQSSAGATVATLDDAGNLHISGHLYTAGKCKTGCAMSGGVIRHAVAYVPEVSEPTIEDFGEASLVAGKAHVLLDPAFANRIDENRSYLVFITPEGETDGLYVVNRSIGGFEVRENHGGHSGAGFSYRIVARPYGARAARLPMETTRLAPSAMIRLPRRPPAMRHL